MIKTATATATTTNSTVDAIKKFGTAAAILGALGLGALGAAGVAAAAPAHHNPGHKAPGSSENAGPVAEHADAEVHAHFLPGFPHAPASGVPASSVPTLGAPAAAVASAPPAVIPGGQTPDLLPTPSSPRSDLPHPGWSPIPNACGSAGCADIVGQ